MKRIYILLAISFIASCSFAQEIQHGYTLEQKNLFGQGVRYTPSVHSDFKIETRGNSISRWYNYGKAIATYNSTKSTLPGEFMSTDTLARVKWSDGCTAPNIAAIADVFGPFTVVFNDGAVAANGTPLITKRDKYFVDSLEFYCAYKRHTAANIVDTLIFDVVVNSTIHVYYFANTDINTYMKIANPTAADTLSWIDMPFDSVHKYNYLNISTKKTYKKLLTESDSVTIPNTNGIVLIPMALPGLDTCNASTYVQTSVRFSPGLAYTMNDTLNGVKQHNNSMEFLSFEDVVTASPNYYATMYYMPRNYSKTAQQWSVHDYNVSYIVPQWIAHNQSKYWNGEYLPSFYFMSTQNGTPTYGYHHHMIYYHAICKTCFSMGIEENQKSTSNLGNAFPNPNDGNSISIPVNCTTNNGTLTIANSLGQIVSSVNNIASGAQNITINTANLNNGIYFYTLESNGAKTTKKFSVVK